MELIGKGLGCPVYTSEYVPDGHYMFAVSKTCRHCGKMLSRVTNPCTASSDGRHEPRAVAVLISESYGGDHAHNQD